VHSAQRPTGHAVDAPHRSQSGTAIRWRFARQVPQT
jgi:hypothetical protein